MPGCSVKSCKNWNGNMKNRGIKLHTFPANSKIADLWIKACGNEKVNLKNGRICSIHFAENCFERKPEHLIVPGDTNIIRLSKTAIPTLNLHNNDDSTRHGRKRNENCFEQKLEHLIVPENTNIVQLSKVAIITSNLPNNDDNAKRRRRRKVYQKYRQDEEESEYNLENVILPHFLSETENIWSSFKIPKEELEDDSKAGPVNETCILPHPLSETEKIWTGWKTPKVELKDDDEADCVSETENNRNGSIIPKAKLKNYGTDRVNETENIQNGLITPKVELEDDETGPVNETENIRDGVKIPELTNYEDLRNKCFTLDLENKRMKIEIIRLNEKLCLQQETQQEAVKKKVYEILTPVFTMEQIKKLLEEKGEI